MPIYTHCSGRATREKRNHQQSYPKLRCSRVTPTTLGRSQTAIQTPPDTPEFLTPARNNHILCSSLHSVSPSAFSHSHSHTTYHYTPPPSLHALIVSMRRRLALRELAPLLLLATLQDTLRQVDQHSLLVALRYPLLKKHLIGHHVLEAMKRLLEAVREAPAAVRMRGSALLNALADAYVLGVHLHSGTAHTAQRCVRGSGIGSHIGCGACVRRVLRPCNAAPSERLYNDFKWRVTPSAVFGFTQSHHRGCWWLARALRERLCVCMHIEAELCARVC